MHTDSDRKIIIAGPCSIESRDQMNSVASAVSRVGAGILRAGFWKPRTHPGSFEGAGPEGLGWLVDAGRANGMETATEVASASHVEECLKAGVDILWIGARTSSSPFQVQEIADALKGVDITVMVKNPLGADIELWIGAFERLAAAGITRFMAVHRGFPVSSPGPYRNEPHWEMSAELRMRLQGVPVICDPSHIAGRADLVGEVACRAMDLGFDGLMVEVHPNPGAALSDAAQQLTPGEFGDLVASLRPRRSSASSEMSSQLEILRSKIDEVDCRIIADIAERMHLSSEIGDLKRRGGMQIIQAGRWESVLSRAMETGKKYGLDEKTVRELFTILHRESVSSQQ